MNYSEIHFAISPLAQGIHGIEYIVPLGFALASSVLLGIVSILGALLRSRWESVRAAWTCIALSLGSTLTLLVMAGNYLTPGAYVMLASASALGFISLALNRLYEKQEPFQKGQFPLIVILFGITFVAVVLGVLTMGR